MPSDKYELIGVILAIILVVALIVSLIMAIAYDSELNEGIVVKKIHENQQMRWMGKFWMNDDEDWYITVNGTNDNGQEITENWKVTEVEYNMINIGDHVVRLTKEDIASIAGGIFVEEE